MNIKTTLLRVLLQNIVFINLCIYEETNDIYAALQREKQLKTCPHENGEMEPQVEVGAH